MKYIKKTKIQDGVYWVEVSQVNLKLLCSCPADIIKHLNQQGFLYPITRDGVTFESGPNCVLLSDRLVQNGSLSNLSEFPLLHMLYKQGMILPNHPNNTDENPILIGIPDQLDAQKEYFFRGNFGLVTEQEFLDVGETIEFARENLSYKLNFAFGTFSKTEDLLNCVPLEDSAVTIKDGVTLRRIRENLFTLHYKDEEIEIDLNLKPDQKIQSAYQLPKTTIPDHYFSIMHTGEGDGWDPNRPCLGSIVIFNGKRYIIDAGPQIATTLEAIDLNPEYMDGIFFTHIHDDHFAGLASLVINSHKIKIIATAVVISTVKKKLAALLSLSGDQVDQYVITQTLIAEEWNNLDGLEVKPVISPHPVDTTIFIFRVKVGGEYKTYGHYSDITAIRWLNKMLIDDDKPFGVTKQIIQKIETLYRLPLNLKKVDVGGLPIHGVASDFIGDKSDRLVLAHTAKPLTSEQLEIGDQAKFGEIDILIEKKPE